MVTKTERELAQKVHLYERLLQLALLAFCFIFLLFVRLHVNNQTTGDEPHYLLMDYSIIHDHDLDLKNNYRNGDYKSFYFAGELSPYKQIAKSQQSDSSPKQYSIHGIGVPLVLLPGFGLAGKAGAVAEMLLIAMLVIWLTWQWTFQLATSRLLSYMAAGSLVVSYFFSGLAGYLYPDLIIAAVTLSALIIITRFADRPRFQILFGAMLGLLVFIHFKTMALVGPLFLLLVYQTWRRNRSLPWGAVASFLPIFLLFFISLYHWYGVWNPTAIYPATVNLHTSPLRSISGMLFDSNRGLLVYSPIMLLLFVGLPVWFKRHRETLLFTILAVAPSIGVLSLFNEWQGGFAPIGRYMMDFLPVFLPAIAFALSLVRANWQKAIVGLLMAATLWVTVQSAVTRILYIQLEITVPRSEFFAQIERHTSLAFDKLLPTFANNNLLPDKHGRQKIALGYLAIAGLLYYGYRESQSLGQSSKRRA